MVDLDIQDLLISPPREVSGSQTSQKFDYQKDWSLCKILKLEENEEEYLAFFDYHDDFVIMNSARNPLEIHFFQIKAVSKNNWTSAALTKVTKQENEEEESSIIGKLYFNKIKFKQYAKSLTFVSTIPLKFKMPGKTTSSNLTDFSLNDLAIEEKNLIKEQISNELNIESSSIEVDQILFHKTDLSPSDSTTHTKGRLFEFLQKKYTGLERFCESIYQTLFGEIKKKSNYARKIIDFEDCKKKKAISSEEVKNYFKFFEETSPEFTQKELIEKIEPRLNQEFSITKSLQISTELRNYVIKRQVVENKILTNLKEKIIEIIEKLNLEVDDLKQLIANVRQKYEKVALEEEKIFNPQFLDAIIIYEYYEKFNR